MIENDEGVATMFDADERVVLNAIQGRTSAAYAAGLLSGAIISQGGKATEL